MNHNIQNCTVIGIDIAKSTFSLHGADAQGQPLYRLTCTRSKLVETLAMAPNCQVFMQACGGAHLLGRQFQAMEH